MTAAAVLVAAPPRDTASDALLLRHPHATTLILWLGACLLYWWMGHDAVRLWNFPDPDDQLRLQQVRDLLGGQSWFDLAQHRINPGHSMPMHWSRWVDLPLAALILIARPFASAHGAEVFACVAGPLIMLGAAMALSGALGRRLAGPAEGLIAAALTPFTVGAFVQMRMLRIDHHSWQIVLAQAMLLGALDRDARRGGCVAGAAGALWLAISLEGLPFAAGTGAVLALIWLFAREADRVRFAAYAAMLGGVAALSLALTAPPWARWATACDALSAVHVAALLAVAAGVPLTVRFARESRLPVKLGALGATAVIAALIYRLGAPQCASGAFSQLEPLVDRMWYQHVYEGLPVWQQPVVAATATMAFALTGMIGAALAWARAGRRLDWLVYGALLAISTLVGVFVYRAGAVASVLAAPGAAALTVLWLDRACGIRSMAPRVLISALAVIAPMPMTAPVVATVLFPDNGPPRPDASKCGSSANYARAAALPASILFTGLDIGPGIIINTRHAIVASSHHRNHVAMNDVIVAFTGDADTAHRLTGAHRAAYVVACPGMPEMRGYVREAPHGFWAQLRAGRTPPWLKRVTIPGSSLAVWRVVA